MTKLSCSNLLLDFQQISMFLNELIAIKLLQLYTVISLESNEIESSDLNGRQIRRFGMFCVLYELLTSIVCSQEQFNSSDAERPVRPHLGHFTPQRLSRLTPSSALREQQVNSKITFPAATSQQTSLAH